jgi:hypothetical protein
MPVSVHRNRRRDVIHVGSELQRIGLGQGSNRGALSRRTMRDLAAIQEGGALNLAQLVASSDHTEVRAMLRKRITEEGMRDVTDVGHLAQELAAGDQFIAAMLIPIVQDFARQTANDIRSFGR